MSLLSASVTSIDRIRGSRAIIRRNVEKLDELLQQTIKRERTKGVEPVDERMPHEFELWPRVQSVIEEVKIIAGVERTSFHNLVPSALTIYADAPAMQSVFRNLFSNALKYAPGGKIVVGVSTTRKDQTELWVRDNGAGIPPDKLDRIFEKVSPDPNKKGSTGLGLLMVKKIIEAHKGTVCIESKVGEGTTVRFTLPKRR